MSEPSTGADDSALPVATGGTPPAAAPLPAGNGGGNGLAEGKRWRHFQISKAHGTGFLAADATSMEEVLLHARPIGEDAAAHREAWDRLSALESDGLVAPREAHEENGWRYEVTAVPAGVPLREWLAAHQPELADIENFVRQVATQLDRLHQQGIVHLRLQPQSIFIGDDSRGMHVRLGGWEYATLHSQADLIPISVNPYYAPPEAAGLFKHKPGPALCAWDWWSLGRLVQEIVHGSHVYGLLFERNVSDDPPELRARAENALLERDPSGVRAGAVELLPNHVHPRVRLLLRGLLASSRDGRWQGEQVLRWTQREAAVDRYDLPRDARLFWWRRRAFTVPEAAEFFLQPDNAFDGVQQFFPATKSPEPTLRQFLAELPALRAEHDKVEQILGYVESFAWRQLPLNPRRAAVAGLAWRALAPNSPRPLSVQRWVVDSAGLQEMFSDAPPAEALAFARVLSTGAYRRAVEAVDAGAGRALALLAESGMDALQRAIGAGWATAADEVGQVRLLWFAFESDKDLASRHERLRNTYATAADPALAALLATEKPSRTELMLLAFVSEHAKELGFVTHAEWRARRAAELGAQAARLRAAIFWERAARMLSAGPALLGRWPVFLGVWAAPLALAVAARAWVWMGVLAAIALGLRWVARALFNTTRQHEAPGSAPWTWRDGPGRAVRMARENSAALGKSAPQLAAEFAQVCADLRALRVKDAQPEAPSRLTELWVLATLANLVPLVLCVLPWLGIDFSARPSPPTVLHHFTPRADGAEVAKDGTLFETYDDGFGKRPRGPLRPWDVPTTTPEPLRVERAGAASPAQRAYARVGGELLLEPYPRRDLKITLAVPVPTLAGGEAGWGIVLYDSAQRELADVRTFFLPTRPEAKRWYWLGNRRVVYLGEPPRLPELQKTLAEP